MYKQEVTLIDIRNIEPDEEQVRKIFKDIGNLASSVAKEGLLEPLKVIKINDKKYRIIDGERRYKACKLLSEKDGYFDKKIPCIIMPKPQNKKITQLITDIHKQKLSPIEEANAFRELIEKEKLSVNDIKARIGKHRSYIMKRLKLLAYSLSTQKKISEGTFKITIAESLDLDTIKRKEDVIVGRIEEENADISRAKEIIYEENYKYEERINSFTNKIDRFSEDISRFNRSIKTELNHAEVLDPVGFKIQQVFQDLDKLDYNLEKVDNIKIKSREVRGKLNELFKKLPNKHEIQKGQI